MRSLMTGPAGAVLISAAATLVICVIVLSSYDVGPQARHMGFHIMSMNVVAPALAAFATMRWRTVSSRTSLLWGATLCQLVLLWGSHAPSVHNAVVSVPALQVAMNVGLLLTALWFWTSLLMLPTTRRWQAIPALLVTAKLACLLAVLLIFAPHALYGAAGHAMHAAVQLSAWPAPDDQHLAGLLMVAACPVSYLVPAVIIAVQLIKPQEPAKATTWRRPIRTTA